MLKVPVPRAGAEKQLEVPCFRCLFVKPISEGWCHPETCQMLDAWLTDNAFSWEKYFLNWLMGIELENVKKNEPMLE